MSQGAAESRDAVVVTGIGMLTSLGQLVQSFWGYRAGMRRIREWEDYAVLGLDEEFDPPEPLEAAIAPLPVSGPYAWDRLVELSLPAAEEAIRCAALDRSQLDRARLAMCLSPLPDKDKDQELGGYFMESFYQQSAMPPLRGNWVYFQGHASGGVALADALTALQHRECDYCLLGGVSTFLNTEALDQLDRRMSLRGARSIDGRTLGEAAAFCILEYASHAERRGAKPLLAIHSVGLAEEPYPHGSTEPSIATGLCDAVRNVVQPAGEGRRMPPSGWVLSDFNGERHRAKEWGLTLTRVHREIGSDVQLWHPAESFGDVGSATVPMLLDMAALAYTEGEALQPSALILASSDGPTRAAVLAGSPHQANRS